MNRKAATEGDDITATRRGNLPSMSVTSEWAKSTFSVANGACVEVRTVDTGGEVAVMVRHSKDGPAAIRYTAAEWRAFIAGAKNSEFDLPE